MAGKVEQIGYIIADLDRYTRSEIIALSLNIAANLRDEPPIGTPIDTGWASANWVPNIGSPYDNPQTQTVKEPNAGQVAAAQGAQEAGFANILGWDKEDGAIFVSNNVPYILPLNAGHSPQSPAGFVGLAVERGIRQTTTRVGSQERRAAGASAYRASRGKR